MVMSRGSNTIQKDIRKDFHDISYVRVRNKATTEYYELWILRVRTLSDEKVVLLKDCEQEKMESKTISSWYALILWIRCIIQIWAAACNCTMIHCFN